MRTSEKICGMGHSMKRKEDPRFIRGQGRYVDDIVLPGMLYMDIVRSPYAHAKIKKIDTSRALGLKHLSCMLISDLEGDAVEVLETLGFEGRRIPGYGFDPDGNPHDMTHLVLAI